MKTQFKKQNGAALVVGLVMLLVMTLIGVTSMNATRTELKVANNIKNHSDAFQTAAVMFERLLVDPAINWLSTSTTIQRGSYGAGYLSSDGLRNGTLGVVFVGCRLSEGSSITGRAGKFLVQHVTVSGNELATAGGNIVGVSRQVGGYTATAAGCQSL